MTPDNERKRPARPGEGRPKKYDPEFAKQASKLCELGATDYELAKFFGVSTLTVQRWLRKM